MSFDQISKIKENKDNILHSAKECSILLGEKQEKPMFGLDFEPGLGMKVLSKNLDEQIENLSNNNVFNILFMGTFKNGKSTLINSLLGEEIMPTAATSCTAIISRTCFGNSRSVKVYDNDNNLIEELSKDAYMEKYRITEEDEEECRKHNTMTRFENIGHATLNSQLDFFKNNVQFIDTPGLEDSISLTKTTDTYVPKANAIIYTLTATSILTGSDKEFLKKHFFNVAQKPKNVFFIVTKMDMLNTDKDREDVKNKVNNFVKDIFSDNGIFNKELLEKRVFFVNAYKATEEQKAGKILELNDTYIPEFRNALDEFLASEERLIAEYKPLVANLANSCVIVDEKRKQSNAAYSLDLEKLKANHETALKKKEELEKKIKETKKRIEIYKENIRGKIEERFKTFVNIDLQEHWKNVVDNPPKTLSLADLMKLFIYKFFNDEKVLETVKPISNTVNEFIIKEFNDWANSLPMYLKNDFELLAHELEAKSEEIINIIIDVDTSFIGDVPVDRNASTANIIQMSISSIAGDFGTAVEARVGGEMKWTDFIMKIIVKQSIQSIIAGLAGAIWSPLVLPVFIAQELYQIHKAGKKLSINMLESIFKHYIEEINKDNKLSTTTASSVIEQIDKTSNKLLDQYMSLMDQTFIEQNNIIKNVESGTAAIEKAQHIQDKTLEELIIRTKEVYKILFNDDISDIVQVANMFTTVKEG